MKIRPMQDRLIVKRNAGADVTPGGIHIPEAGKEKPLEGTVFAVGPGKRREDGQIHPLGVKEGDTILFAKYAGAEIKINGADYLMMREEDILGVYEPE
jgi:chaperonin GroES